MNDPIYITDVIKSLTELIVKDYKRNKLLRLITMEVQQLILKQHSRIMNSKEQQHKHIIKLEEQLRLELLRQFLQANQTQLAKGIDVHNSKTTVVPDSAEYLELLGSMIRNGQLVAFPTETVYGLGADATNEKALLEIYRVKKRPLTDPIIVHVLDSKSALELVLPQSNNELDLFTKLTSKYWPGPLTVILKANLQVLPRVVTAQTGYVGLRSPKCKYSRQLISSSQRPIGAPSANLFSHVSPTSAVHVLNDFYDQQIAIVDGQRCQYGVESTVVKIVGDNLQILREGSLSTKKLTQFVQHQFQGRVMITVKKRVQKQEQNQNMEAPGQLLKHYAPYLPCYSTNFQNLSQIKQELVYDQVNQSKISFSQIAFISFSQKFNLLKDKFKFYLSVNDLDESQIRNQHLQQDQKFCTLEEKKKMRSLYYFLRRAQNLDVKSIIIGWDDPKQGTLWDKIFRSTQGHTANII